MSKRFKFKETEGRALARWSDLKIGRSQSRDLCRYRRTTRLSEKNGHKHNKLHSPWHTASRPGCIGPWNITWNISRDNIMISLRFPSKWTAKKGRIASVVA